MPYVNVTGILILSDRQNYSKNTTLSWDFLKRTFAFFQDMEHTCTCNFMKSSVVAGLCEGVKLDVYYPGFPTLYHVSHKVQFYKNFLLNLHVILHKKHIGTSTLYMYILQVNNFLGKPSNPSK